MDTCICMAESLCYPPETVTTLLIGYNPIQNKKLKKKKKARAVSPIPHPRASGISVDGNRGWRCGRGSGGEVTAELEEPYLGLILAGGGGTVYNQKQK